MTGSDTQHTFVGLLTLSEPRALTLARHVALRLAAHPQVELVSVSPRDGWRGGGADIVIQASAQQRAARVWDDTLVEVLADTGLLGKVVVLSSLSTVTGAAADLRGAHETMREALVGDGLY